MNISGQPTTMTSKEVATLTGKDLGNVHRDIRAMVGALVGAVEGNGMDWKMTKDGMLPFLNHEQIQGLTIDWDYRGYAEQFHLPKRLALILVSGYSITMRAAIVDRWQQLEGAAGVPVGLNLRDPGQLLLAAAQLAELVQEQQAQLTAQAPRVAFAEAVGAAEDDQKVYVVAKVLGQGPIKFRAWLKQIGFLMPSGMPYQHHIDAGRARVIEVPFKDPATGSQRLRPEVRITGRGLTFLQQKLAKAGTPQGA